MQPKLPLWRSQFRAFCIRAFTIIGALIAFVHIVHAQQESRDDAFRVHLLGTGSPLYQTDRTGPAILVEAGKQRLLFDVGRGTGQRLFEAGIEFGSVDKVFLTHLHSDHTIGLPILWLDGWLRGRSIPLQVWGPVGTTDLVRGLEAAFAYDVGTRISKNDGSKLLVTHISEPGVIYRGDGVSVEAIVVDHGPIKPAFGFRIDYRGRSVVLSGDTRFAPALVERAKGVDVFIHEVAAASRDLAQTPIVKAILAIHTLPGEVARAFSTARPKLGVYSHIVLFGIDEAELEKETRQGFDGPLIVGSDLMIIDIAADVTVARNGAVIFRTSKP